MTSGERDRNSLITMSEFERAIAPSSHAYRIRKKFLHANPSPEKISDYASALSSTVFASYLPPIPSPLSSSHAHPTSDSFTCHRILHVPSSSLPHLPPPRTDISTSLKAPTRFSLALSQTPSFSFLSFPSLPFPSHPFPCHSQSHLPAQPRFTLTSQNPSPSLPLSLSKYQKSKMPLTTIPPPIIIVTPFTNKDVKGRK